MYYWKFVVFWTGVGGSSAVSGCPFWVWESLAASILVSPKAIWVNRLKNILVNNVFPLDLAITDHAIEECKKILEALNDETTNDNVRTQFTQISCTVDNCEQSLTKPMVGEVGGRGLDLSPCRQWTTSCNTSERYGSTRTMRFFFLTRRMSPANFSLPRQNKGQDSASAVHTSHYAWARNLQKDCATWLDIYRVQNKTDKRESVDVYLGTYRERPRSDRKTKRWLLN